MAGQRPYPLRDSGRDGDQRLVVVQLDPKHARRLRGPEPAGVKHPKGDRHLPEDLTGPALADHALLAVDEPEHLDATLEHSEQRAGVSLVDG